MISPCCRGGIALTRRRTVAQFLAEANRVHNGRSGYPGLRFVHSQQKIDIECMEHGIFQQSSQKHLAGQGCRKCRPRPQPQSRDAFVEKARAIHGDRFAYDRVVYVNNHTPVTIVCRAKGHVFSMLPSNHTHSRFPQGCRECSGRARWSLERFLHEAKELHGERYSYEQIQEVTSGRRRLPILCRKGHGTFMQSPAHHIYRKQGCAECAGVKRGARSNL